MKKAIILLAVISISFIQANAQIKFGVKAGLNLANLKISNGSFSASYKSKADFHAGGLVNIPLVSSLYLQPEVVYSGQGTKIDGEGTSAKFNEGYINVPVLVQYKTPIGVFIETGPQIGFLLSAKSKVDGTTTDEKDQYNSTDFSWVGGVGYLTPFNLGIDARYNFGIANVAKNTGDGTKARNNVFQIGVFYLFGGK